MHTPVHADRACPRRERGRRVVGPDDQTRAVAELRGRRTCDGVKGDDLDPMAGVTIGHPARRLRRRDGQSRITVGLDVELDHQAHGR